MATSPLFQWRAGFQIGVLALLVASVAHAHPAPPPAPKLLMSEKDVSAMLPSDSTPTLGQSRVGQAPTQPILFEGRKYEQITNGAALELDQRTGYLAVFDAETGTRQALIKVYVVPFDPTLEADVQDIFFTTMVLDDSTRRILIENERGASFAVDLDTHAVQALN